MNIGSALRTYARIVERGSMTAAARDLGISQPAVSKIIRDLEAHIGARLLERSSRAMRPTSQGRALYEAVGGPLATIDAAIEAVRGDAGDIGGELHVHGPLCLGERQLNAIVLDFQRHHPDVVIRLTLEDRSIDLIESNVDLSVRMGRPEAQNLVTRRIGATRRILVAAPDYIARRGAPKSPRNLARHDLIVTTSILSHRGTFVLAKDAAETEVAAKPVLTTNNPQVLLGALAAGRGIGVAQLLLVAEELVAGRLVRVLPRHDVKPTELYLAYPSARFLRPVVRAFIDAMVPALRAIEGIV